MRFSHILAALSLCAVACGALCDTPKQPLAERHVARGMNCAVCHAQPMGGPVKLDADRHEACVQCHGWYDKVAAKTQPKDPEDQNPHSQHDGNLPCSVCHKGHKPGENYCGKCHMWNFRVP